MTFEEYKECVRASAPGGRSEIINDTLRLSLFAGIILDQTELFVMAGRIEVKAWVPALSAILWHTVALAFGSGVTLRPDWPRIVTPVPERGEFEYEWLERRSRRLAWRVSQVAAATYLGEYGDMGTRLHRVIECVVELCRWLDVTVEEVAAGGRVNNLLSGPEAKQPHEPGRMAFQFYDPPSNTRLVFWSGKRLVKGL